MMPSIACVKAWLIFNANVSIDMNYTLEVCFYLIDKCPFSKEPKLEPTYLSIILYLIKYILQYNKFFYLAEYFIFILF